MSDRSNYSKWDLSTSKFWNNTSKIHIYSFINSKINHVVNGRLDPPLSTLHSNMNVWNFAEQGMETKTRVPSGGAKGAERCFCDCE